MRQALWQRRKAALLLAVALIAAGLGTLAYTNHLLRRPEQLTIDARFQIRGAERQRTAGVVLVSIDKTTFNYLRNHNLPAPFPFPRRYDARVIDELHRAGAKVIAYDVEFSHPTASQCQARQRAADAQRASLPHRLRRRQAHRRRRGRDRGRPVGRPLDYLAPEQIPERRSARAPTSTRSPVCCTTA
jgi:CHASE2 domain-containing sensor protein